MEIIRPSKPSKRKFCSKTEYETDLGVALLKGWILVEHHYTAAKWFTKQLAPVMGNSPTREIYYFTNEHRHNDNA